MNKAKLKSYAPQARKDFIAAVTARANLLGISSEAGKLDVAVSQPQGDATVIAGQAWPVKVHGQRQQLIARIQRDGFAQTMEAVAYTWFNRFAALRYMELHDYLGHGHRALSSLEGTLPDILTHAADLAQSGALPGLKPALVVEMKLAGNRDGELYRLLMVAQCNALSNVMPFLFERIDDETELLLPDNLLRTDSVIAKLVASIEEEDWKEVEIIGWLYQFYISEKKDEVIGKVVKSEDIPAATQLFTPNWIVQYLVQNSVGRIWLMANPASTLKTQWQYYIAPADQSPEVQAQLDALIQTRVKEDGDSLNPESMSMLDPACGSGHILVEAYDVLKAIYLERGYQPRSIPRLILEKNLYGLDIDDRAAQMAGFALLMKARADDRRLFNEPIKLNVMSLQESKGLSLDEVATHLMSFGVTRGALKSLLDSFAHAKTFGSLIQIPSVLKVQLAELSDSLQKALQSGDLYAKAAANDLSPLVVQARVLGMQFDAVVANPPYMGVKGMNPMMKDYAKATFPGNKSDLFAMFIERGFGWCKPTSFNSMVTMQSWMFLSSYEDMREKILRERMVSTFIHIGYNSFPELNSKIAQACAFSIFAGRFDGAIGLYVNLNLAPQMANKGMVLLGKTNDLLHSVCQEEFKKIPGSPLAYWVSSPVRAAFSENEKLSDFAVLSGGMTTGNNECFLRLWHEVSIDKIGMNLANRQAAKLSEMKWFPYNKGGPSRKWFGNNTYVVNWQNDGEAIEKTGRAFPRSKGYYFKQSITYSATTSLHFGARHSDAGFLFDAKGPSAFADGDAHYGILAFLASNPVAFFLKFLNPTIEFQTGDLARLPLSKANFLEHDNISLAKRAIEISREDWSCEETSWEFNQLPFGENIVNRASLSLAWEDWQNEAETKVSELRALEQRNNSYWINAYALNDEISAEVLESQITLARANREKDCQRLISYAIGCMMGRYSLDEPGLIYAIAGNACFDATRYNKFPADADGIVPLTDELWFEDEAASRIREFLIAVWGVGTLGENMAWLAESLGSKAGETPDETIRSYLADKFYKDHLQTYKKRPIYWLFSSGKQGAFQALVYLHRYHEGTLSRMRTEYVVPLTGKIQSRIEMLERDTAAASSTTARNKLAKEIEKLKKKNVELLAYDEQLRHHADMRITLDLDDGVKVNYGKFGDLLVDVKAVTGGGSDD